MIDAIALQVNVGQRVVGFAINVMDEQTALYLSSEKGRFENVALQSNLREYASDLTTELDSIEDYLNHEKKRQRALVPKLHKISKGSAYEVTQFYVESVDTMVQDSIFCEWFPSYLDLQVQKEDSELSLAIQEGHLQSIPELVGKLIENFSDICEFNDNVRRCSKIQSGRLARHLLEKSRS